jgi:hypothetical protein
MRQWPKTLKSKLNFKEDYQVRVHSGQAGKLDHVNADQRCSKESQKITLGRHGT